jgi:hypothetical protein
MDISDEAVLGDTPLAPVRHDFARASGRLPSERFDAVLAVGILERVPGADANWVLRELFASAERALVLRIAVAAEEGVGSEDWWRRRVEAIANHYPTVSWELDAVRHRAAGATTVDAIQVRRVPPPGQPLVWALTGDDLAGDRQSRRIGRALGWRFEEKRLAHGPLAGLRGRLFGAAVGSLGPARSVSLASPWPDVLITSGRRSASVARWVRQQSGGRTRLVQLGRPGGPFALFDLIIAAPDDRLPIRKNVLQVAAPLSDLPDQKGPASAPAEAARPVIALLLASRLSPYRLNEQAARELGQAASAEVGLHRGSLAIAADPAVQQGLIDALRSGVVCPATVLKRDEDPRPGMLATADRFILTAGDAEMLAEATLTGRPVAIFDLPRWYDDVPVVKPLVRAVLAMLGGQTYRGTPLQQHIPGRVIDWLTTKGLLYRPRDLDALYRSLEARGLVVRLGADTPVAAPRPLDDLPRVVARVRHLLTEVTQPV